MKIIAKSHIHAGIDRVWLENLPAADGFKISTHRCEESGLDHCVKTGDSDTVYWARRGDRPNLSRMVTGRDPEPTNSVVTVEVPDGDNGVVLATAYFGNEVADREPFQQEWSAEECEAWVLANPGSFWATHALVAEA